MGHLAARVKLNEPGQRRIDERMVGCAAGKEEIGVSGEVEAARFAIFVGKLDEKISGVFIAQAVDHLIDLSGPGGVALRASEELREALAAGSESAEIVDVLRGWLELRAAGFAPRRE